MEYNLADLFESVVDVVPGREALVYIDHPGTGAERRLTYAQLDAAANRVAHHLIDSGIRPGEHLGLHLYNGVEYVQTVLGCLKARIVPVNVNYRYVEEELVYLYRDADLVALVFDTEFTDRVAAALPRASALRHLLRVGDAAADAASLPALDFAEAEAAGSPERGFPPRSADDQFIIYTGGTTGMPKGVMWRQEDLFFSGLGGGAPTGEPVTKPEELAERVAAGGEGITFFPTPPLMHGTSTLTAFIGFNFGQRVVIHRKFVPEEVLRTVEREKVTSMSLVGDAMLRPLIDALRGPMKGTDCSSMFSVSSSGAIMSETVREQFQSLVPNVMLLNNYGSSESGFNGTATADSGAGQGFRLRVNSRTQVVDPATYEPVAVGEPGRVAQRGHVPLGYYNDPKKTAETFFQKDGERWVLLGDMATVDEEGIVTVLGRGSQCINTGGEKVYPEEVEQALKSHPDVYDALVAGVPDEKWGNHVAAVVQLREGAGSPSLEDIQTHCRSHLAGYKIPRQLVITDTIQRSPSGKADYRWARSVATQAAH
ncbi:MULTISPECIES: acyl-CoA synthetase [Streptomyces]|uniref:acyl-CoA synthetase n=1 Tax=Streptomyces TaxID=1883 RepID=UPI000BD016D4|nr:MULTISPECIES: acyl-CoA synthetase [unclassified Streptomyces]NMI56186.1 acyl-CoA synthetase [Streptomyces sp. RLA2-12]QDN55625.1 acyl-CoA synthetase [Streptomyces sp. S1D4-20]QDN65803.1 acyl-CoA synthetase [Streptomyces sp. S1D4-14]QDN96446.1 acyl-CoA synthetase [Streptomyces sp. RLB1-9]QDO18154.1 acyl-CoA synthetase [Streptomyces sp. S1A1-8]